MRRASPIRMVCKPPKWSKAKPRRPGGRQRWGHIFDDPSEPYRNWSKCRWACSRSIKVAVFRNVRDRRQYAVLHPSTKRGVRWQLSWFDELGAKGDTPGKTCDGVLLTAFGHRKGYFPGQNAREWKLESVVTKEGQLVGSQRRRR